MKPLIIASKEKKKKKNPYRLRARLVEKKREREKREKRINWVKSWGKWCVLCQPILTHHVSKTTYFHQSLIHHIVFICGQRVICLPPSWNSLAQKFLLFCPTSQIHSQTPLSCYMFNPYYKSLPSTRHIYCYTPLSACLQASKSCIRHGSSRHGSI